LRDRAVRPGRRKSAPSTIWDNEDGTFTVRDLDLGIFIYLRALDDKSLDIRILDAAKVGPAQHDVIFYGEYETGRRLQLELINGHSVPCIRWCAAQRDLKRLVRRFIDEGPSHRRGELRS
jgi:hypothetical protein